MITLEQIVLDLDRVANFRIRSEKKGGEIELDEVYTGNADFCLKGSFSSLRALRNALNELLQEDDNNDAIRR